MQNLSKHHQLLVSAGGAVASGPFYSALSYVGAAEGTGGGLIEAVPLGAADASRISIIGVFTDSFSSPPGNIIVGSFGTFAPLVENNAAIGDDYGIALYAVSTPTGTTADIEVDSGGFINCAVWRVLMASAVPHDTSTASQTSLTTSHPYTGVIVPSNGFAVAVQTYSQDAVSATINTSFVERQDTEAPANCMYYAADLESVAGFGSSTVTITTNASAYSTGCIASFKGDGS